LEKVVNLCARQIRPENGDFWTKVDRNRQFKYANPTVPMRSTIRAPHFGVWMKECRGARSYESVAAEMRPLL
jgi:hypothetical protein